MGDEHSKDKNKPAQNGAGIEDTGRERGYHPSSQYIHGAFHSPHWDYSRHVVPPMSCSATYRLDSASRGASGFVQFGTGEFPEQEILIYDRLQEPTSEMLEDRIASAEGGEIAVSFATGMAAISASMGCILSAGDHVVAHKCLYGCTASLLMNWYPRLGIEVTFVDANDADALDNAVRPETRALYIESPVNPTLDLIDLEMVAGIAAKHNEGRDEEKRIYSICDNTFSTPVCQRPISFGIDVVVHSLTKGIGGFGTDMGGIVVAPKSLQFALMMYRKDFGGSLSPKAAWPPLVHGLPTLPVRMARQQATAMEVAEYINAHPLTDRVRYPGLPGDTEHELAKKQMLGYDGEFMPGSMIYFTLKDAPGSNVRGEAFINYAADNAYTITLAVSLGQIKTLIENPCSMTHSTIDPEQQVDAGIEPGGIRLSIGLEDPRDIIRDLEMCFEHVAKLGAKAG